jgi:gamma-glutamylcyclotransferase (GGCT)/AIG2-like uncharacterized protein YtfP
MNLFAYGTLMIPEIWNRVVGVPAASQPAMLAGYAVFTVHGDVYPVMVPAGASDLVHGVAYFDLDDATLARLDQYESDLYDRETVEVALAAGATLRCEAYVLPSDRRHAASSALWDRAEFERESLARYLGRM